jgi:hypothetical protein
MPEADPDARWPGYDRLVDAIADGAIAMVGAGCSAGLAYPRWSALLELLDAECARLYPADAELRAARASSDPLVRAEVFARLMGPARLGMFVAAVYAHRSITSSRPTTRTRWRTRSSAITAWPAFGASTWTRWRPGRLS